MTQAEARAHIERYALSPRHRVVAIAALESAPYEERDGTQWLVLANNIVTALDELEAGYTAQQVEPGAADEVSWVWAPTRRKGLDFHLYPDGATNGSRTACGRSAMSSTSVRLYEADARASGMTPCPRCYP